jgi:PAS domain S-box-containing protein
LWPVSRPCHAGEDDLLRPVSRPSHAGVKMTQPESFAVREVRSMKTHQDTSDSNLALRRKAEERLHAHVAVVPSLTRGEIEQLVHELDVHHIELEMQNEELRSSQQTLEESRNRYADLYDFAPLGYLTLGANGIVEKANLTVTAMLETERQWLENGQFSTYVAAKDKDIFHQYLRNCQDGAAETTAELRLVGRKGRVTRVHLRGVAVSTDDGLRYRTAVTDITDITALQEAEQQLQALNAALEDRVIERTALAEQRAAELQVLAGQLTRIEEQERRRLAQTLHDGLQQVLFAARLALSRVQLRSEGEVAAMLGRVEDLLSEAMLQSRSLTTELSPPVLYDVGLAAALEWLANRMNVQHGLQVNVRVEMEPKFLPEGLRTFFFRAVGELLFNVVKHGKTNQVEVTAERVGDDMVRVVVADAGAGFDPATANIRPSTGGMGLFSIRERLQLLGGNMELESRPGQGTRIIMIARRPLPVAEAVETSEAASSPHAAIPSPHLVSRGGKIRVVLADDHPVLREGLARRLLEERDIDVVGTAGDGLGAIELARRFQPDVVLMDVTMPRMDGFEATRRIVGELPHVHVIGLSMHETDHMGDALLKAGAAAFLSKGGAIEQLLEAIRTQAGIAVSD